MTGEQRVLAILESVDSIESWELAKRAELMDNTSNKYVKYLRDKGYKIVTERVDGKAWCRYRLVKSEGRVYNGGVRHSQSVGEPSTDVSGVTNRHGPFSFWRQLMSACPKCHCMYAYRVQDAYVCSACGGMVTVDEGDYRDDHT